MLVFDTKTKISAYLQGNYKNAKIGLVPTMGALHNGHLSLLAQSLDENDITVISVFVNPTQFNNPEDLEKYPRNLEKDLEKIESLSDKVVVFAPSAKEMYGEDIVSTSYQFDGLEFQMEGAARPGHFDGVGTIITFLFEIINPTNAYFGEKDFQQLQIIRTLAKNYNFNVNIIGCPIFRQGDGLAMSSRNERLSEEGKKAAPFLYQVLKNAKNLFKTESIQNVKKFVEEQINNNPDFDLEYFEIADVETLRTATIKEEKKKYRGFLVANLEGVRLIDNISLN